MVIGTVRVDGKIAETARLALGVRTRTEAVRRALELVVGVEGFKQLMRENEGKLGFEHFER